jgi:hypothetical protein
VDYTLTYDVGQVTFLNPDALFGSQPTQVTARFEEQGVFAIAPTSILGLSTTYSLGERGEINLIGMYQREQSAFNRPQLGLEASANLVAGVNTDLRFKPQAITRLLNKLTSTPTTAPSALDLSGEFAVTHPDPNRSGQAYLEEFEGDAGLPVSLRESAWEFGSRPQSGDGLADIGFGGGFDPEDAVQLTWQNLVEGTDRQAFELRPEDLDTLIRISGSSEQRETALFLTLHADTAGGFLAAGGSKAARWTQPRRDFRPRWRTMMLPLSPTGVDLTRNEFLEFWVFQPPSRTADSAGVRLVFDIGSIDEDAIAVAPTTLTVGGAGDSLFAGRQYVGLGRLDTERQEIGSFNAQTDDIGILSDRPTLSDGQTGEDLGEVPLCQIVLSNQVPVFPWGDLSSRCTRGNGVLDTEDLNGDNGLNSSGANDNVFRYVVSLQPGSKYFVRTGRTADWQLYRIPIRQPDATIGTPNLRLVQHMRMLVAAPPDAGTPDVTANFALARLRFVGSPWTRRSDRPIAGFSGSISNPTGEVVASVISTENSVDLGYEPPPGVVEGLSRRNDGSSGVQINEKSLRIIGRELNVGDRAEAYLRFTAGPQNALGYRTLRVWARGRGAGWEEGELEAFVKVGSDDRNFYLYHTTAHSTAWTPELEIDLETWRRLRAEVEQRWLSGQPPSGADTCGTLDSTAYVACDGPYLVHLGSPGINPPNLAAMQEISAGLYRARGAGILPEAELWVDDIRLSSPVSELGTAVSLDARLAASDVGTFNVSYVRQNGQFRQINADPTYRTEGTLQMSSAMRLDRFLPAGLGLVIPVNAAYARTGVDPELLTGTDLRGDALSGLRRPSSRTSTYSISIRRGVKGSSFLTRGLLDPLSLSASLTQGRSQTEYSQTQAKTSNVALGYALLLSRRGFKLPFGGVIGGLPKWLRESEAGKGLSAATFSLTPSSVRMSSVLSRDQGDYSSFAIPIARADDAAIRPTLSLTHLWRNSAGLSWQPLGMLNLSSDLVSTRDLRVYSDSSSLGRVAYAERRFLLGVPVGVERDRTLTSSLSLTPKLTSWLRPRLVTGSSFVLSRTLTSRQPVRVDGDSGEFILPQTLNNSRARELGAALDLSTLLRHAAGDSNKVAVAFGRIRPLDLSVRTNRTSTYDLAAFDPSLGYMLALGGLDRFLDQNGTAALGVSDGRTTTLTSGADLPLGFAGTLSYSLTTNTRYQLVSGGRVQTSTRQREWPAGSVRWTQSFRGGPLALITTNLGFRHREGTATQPGGEGGVSNAITSSSLNPDLQVSFRNGMALSVGYASLEQHTANSGNTTLLDQDDITGSFSYAFRLPPSFGRSRRRVRSSVTVVDSKSLTCLERSDGNPCTVVADTRRRELRGGLDTDVATSLSAGLQVGYTLNDARHLNRRTSQISLLASFQLTLDTGSY